MCFSRVLEPNVGFSRAYPECFEWPLCALHLGIPVLTEPKDPDPREVRQRHLSCISWLRRTGSSKPSPDNVL